MSDDLEGDPEAEALKPKVSKEVLIASVAMGALFGLGLAVAGYVFEQYIPATGLRVLPDAGPVEVPDVIGLDGGPGGAAPWLGEEPEGETEAETEAEGG